MAGMIPEHKIEEVRQAADIAEVIGMYVSLNRSGNVLRGLCPFHAEKTPSFTVNPQRRIFHCFGCNVGGNVFRFLMMQKGISFPEAVTELAERYGIDLPRVNAERISRDKSIKAALYKTVALAQAYFSEELFSPNGTTAREYLFGRGLQAELIREYGVGWVQPGWDNLLRFLESKKVPPEYMEKAGLIRPRNSGRGHYDVFRGRVITPIFDLDSKPVAFGGRLLEEDDQQPKYLNSPETPIFNKGRLLYGLDRARPVLRDEKTVVIVEGYFDLLSLAAHGIRNVVATLGTALTSSHLRLLKGYANDIYLVFDADEAGRAAAARSLPLFMSADMEAKVLKLPDGHDPDTYVRQKGPDAFRQALTGAVSLLDFYLNQTLARYPDNLAGRSRASQEVLEVINRVEGQTRVELLRKALAERLGVSEESLALSERRREMVKSPLSRPHAKNTVPVEMAPAMETGLISLLLLHPDVQLDIFSAGLDDHFQDPVCRRVYQTMARQYAAHGSVDVDRLVENLEDQAADMVSGLALTDDGLSEMDAEIAAKDYIDRLNQRTRHMEGRELSRRIRQAEEAGDVAQLKLLLQEKFN
jgi:DNA primase